MNQPNPDSPDPQHGLAPEPFDFQEHARRLQSGSGGGGAGNSNEQGRLSTRLSWMVIALVSALLFWTHLVPKITKAPTFDPSAAAVPAPQPQDYPSIELKLMGRFALSSLRDYQSAVMLAQQVDEMAYTPLDRLRAAMVHLAIRGKSAGESRPGPDPVTAALEAAGLPAETVEPGGPIDLSRDIELVERLARDGAGSLSPNERDLLLDRHGWFAQVALWHELPRNSPEITGLTTRGNVALASVLLVGLGAVVGLVGGLVLLPLGFIRMSNRPHQIAAAQRRFDGPRAPIIESVAWFMVLFAGVQALGIYPAVREIMWLLIWVPGLALFWPLLRGVTWRDLRGALGWHGGRGWLTEIGAGVVGYIAGLPILAVGILLTLVATTLTGIEASHPVGQQVPQTLWDAAQLYLLAAAWAPLVEESVFRGAMLFHVRRRTGVVLSALLTGFIFGIIHPQGITGFYAPMSIGIAFALIREWRGSLIPTITAHALNNGVIVSLMLLILM